MSGSGQSFSETAKEATESPRWLYSRRGSREQRAAKRQVCPGAASPRCWSVGESWLESGEGPGTWRQLLQGHEATLYHWLLPLCQEGIPGQDTVSEIHP